MRKTLIAYYSRTGNTEMVAEAIHQALEGDRTLSAIDTAGRLDSFHLIFIGFPVESHSVPFPAEIFLKSIRAGTKVALFSTHGAFPHHPMAREALEYAAVLSGHCRLLGTFHCRGKLSLPALESFARSPEHQEWTKMAPSSASHPDAHDLAEAGIFARHMKARSAETPDFPKGEF